MRYKNNFVSLSFDDILLLPSGKLEVDYREDVNLSMTIGNPKQPQSQLTLSTPIMIAPMIKARIRLMNCFDFMVVGLKGLAPLGLKICFESVTIRKINPNFTF